MKNLSLYLEYLKAYGFKKPKKDFDVEIINTNDTNKLSNNLKTGGRLKNDLKAYDIYKPDTKIYKKDGNVIMEALLEIMPSDGECYAKQCIPNELLKKYYKSVFNKDPPNCSIKMIRELQGKLDCRSEKCVQERMGDKIPKYTYKPVALPNPKWLDNKNIDDFLSDVIPKFEEFDHIPFQMADFIEMNGELINYVPTKNRKFGCVLNTDISTGPGKHWYCIFGYFEKDILYIEYFETSGTKIKKEIIDLAKHYTNLGLKVKLINVTQVLSDNYKENGKIFTLNKDLYKEYDDKLTIYDENRSYAPVQKDTFSCGTFSCIYIWYRLHGIGIPDFITNKQLLSNDFVASLRDRFWFTDNIY